MIKIGNNIKGLIFDCDGTLADTMPVHFCAWKKTFSKYNRKFPFELFDSMKGAPAEKIIKTYNEKFNDNLDVIEFSKVKDSIAHEMLAGTEPIGFVKEIALKFKNILPQAVASGGKRENVLITLKAIEMDNHFDAVITADDNVGEKPEPGIFLEAAKRIGVNPEDCLVFEDADFGIEAAKNANMNYIDVREYIEK